MRETEKGENGAQGEDESQSSESEGDGAEVGHGHHHLKQEVPSQSCAHTFIYLHMLECWDGTTCKILYLYDTPMVSRFSFLNPVDDCDRLFVHNNICLILFIL